MYAQVIKGRTKDAAGLRRQFERWRDEVRPGAIGFVGSTVGIADDGTVIGIARFADADAAKANAGRPEQDAWWQETAELLDGEPTFRESSDVGTLLAGGSDAAAFVQVMEGTISDRSKAEQMESSETLAQLQAARPDLIGAVRVWFPGGAFVEAAYFTSEAEARTGETSPEFESAQQEYMALRGDMTYIDLHDPLMV